jgi:threonine dehydrogenase-like Zn-dependent dehydrogenase
MKAILNTAPGQLTWSDCPQPVPGRGQVRIRTAACGICATDIHMIAGWQRTGFPSIPGHEWSGRVDAVGEGVDPDLVGKACVAENVLADGGEVGFEHPGGYAQYLLTEAAAVYPLPDRYPLQQAALIEPLAVAVRGLKRLGLMGQPQASRRSVLVFGDGPIGLLTVILLRHFGFEDVTLVGGREPRLALAQSLGAQTTVNYHAHSETLAPSLLKKHEPYQYLIEASGSPQALAACIEIAAREGKLLVMGDYGAGQSNFLWNTLLHHELELIGSNASAGSWREAVDLAVRADLPLNRLISHVFPASEFQQGVELTRSRASAAIKVVLDWGL